MSDLRAVVAAIDDFRQRWNVSEADWKRVLEMCAATHATGGACRDPPTEADLAGALAALRIADGGT